MEVPYHALNHRNRVQNFDSYVQKHPDAVMLSLSSIYESVWRFFAKENNLKCLPPPVIINHTRKYPQDNEYFSTAMFNTGYARVLYGDFYGLANVPKTVFSHIYEIQFYTKAFRRHMNTLCGCRCVDSVLVVEIAHFLFHELFHFLDHMNMTIALIDAYDTDPETMKTIISAYLNKDRSLVSNDEQYTERRAFIMLEKYVRSQFEDDLHLTFGGPAYQFMYTRGKFMNYLSVIAFLECLKLDNAVMYETLTEEEMIPLAENALQATTDMAEIHHWMTNKRTIKFVIVD